MNLLCRSVGVVSSISLICPSGIRPMGRIAVLAPLSEDFRDVLIEGGRAIGLVPVLVDETLDRTIAIGPKVDGIKSDLYVWGNGWCGGISVDPISNCNFGPISSLPFGPYVGACLAAAEIYKAARMRLTDFVGNRHAFYSLWSHQAAEQPIIDGPVSAEVELDATLVGVGAVGCAFLHTLWSSPDIHGRLTLVDNDEKGLEVTNLNRYALFGQGSVKRQKASEAARLLLGAELDLTPIDAGIETFTIQTTHVVSAVDTNRARHAIQMRYPGQLFSASTFNLRAEVLKCGPPGIGSCLRCHNPPEKVIPDDVLRARLRDGSAEDRAHWAAAANLTTEDVGEWISKPQCGQLGERLLPLLREADTPIQFAVGFVSVMAGTMLAAEFVKDHLPGVSVLSSTTQRASFQFFTPTARTNRASAYARDPKCPMCDPTTVQGQIWKDRYDRSISAHSGIKQCP